MPRGRGSNPWPALVNNYVDVSGSVVAIDSESMSSWVDSTTTLLPWLRLRLRLRSWVSFDTDRMGDSEWPVCACMPGDRSLLKGTTFPNSFFMSRSHCLGVPAGRWGTIVRTRGPTRSGTLTGSCILIICFGCSCAWMLLCLDAAPMLGCCSSAWDAPLLGCSSAWMLLCLGCPLQCA